MRRPQQQPRPKSHFYLGTIQWRPNEPEYEQLTWMEVSNFVNAFGQLLPWDIFLETTNVADVLSPFVLDTIEEAASRSEEMQGYSGVIVAEIPINDTHVIVLQARNAFKVFIPPGLFPNIAAFRDYAVGVWRQHKSEEAPIPLMQQYQEGLGPFGESLQITEQGSFEAESGEEEGEEELGEEELGELDDEGSWEER